MTPHEQTALGAQSNTGTTTSSALGRLSIQPQKRANVEHRLSVILAPNHVKILKREASTHLNPMPQLLQSDL